MRYNELGRTGLRVSALGFGASPLGHVFGPINEDEGVRAVREALDLGINFFDVSPAYGETVAETVLGRALHGVERTSYVLATKVGRYGKVDFDFSPERVRRSVDESLKRLGSDFVDLMQCHDIEFGDVDEIISETLPALTQLQAQGKVRHIGVTGYPLGVLRRVADAYPVDSVLSYCHLTLADQTLDRSLPYFHDRGVAVINASPLAMGALTTRGAPSWHPAPPDVLGACSRAAALCASRGSDLAKLALQFSVSAPGPASTLFGSADPRNVQQNVRWVEEPMDDELLTDVLSILRSVRDVTWPSGRPENDFD